MICSLYKREHFFFKNYSVPGSKHEYSCMEELRNDYYYESVSSGLWVSIFVSSSNLSISKLCC